MFVEVEGVASFHAQKLAIHSGAIAVIGAHDLAVTNAESCLAAVRTVRTDGPDVLHLPRPGLITVGPTCQCTDGTDIDTSTTFIALEMIALVRDNLGGSAAVSNAQSVHAEGLAADTNAAIAENTARGVVENDRRPLLLVD